MGANGSEANGSATNDTSHMTTGVAPLLYQGTVYTQPLAAHIAALFHQQVIPHTYNRHRLLVDTQEHAIVPNFWLPSANTFLFIHTSWPDYDQCVEHEAIAKLGHSVTVLVGTELGTAVACPSTPSPVMHGWTLECLTAELKPGWTAFMWVDNRVQLTNMVFPADKRAIHASLVQALE